jgi:hypothetical protein
MKALLLAFALFFLCKKVQNVELGKRNSNTDVKKSSARILPSNQIQYKNPFDPEICQAAFFFCNVNPALCDEALHASKLAEDGLLDELMATRDPNSMDAPIIKESEEDTNTPNDENINQEPFSSSDNVGDESLDSCEKSCEEQWLQDSGLTLCGIYACSIKNMVTPGVSIPVSWVVNAIMGYVSGEYEGDVDQVVAEAEATFGLEMAYYGPEFVVWVLSKLTPRSN